MLTKLFDAQRPPELSNLFEPFLFQFKCGYQHLLLIFLHHLLMQKLFILNLFDPLLRLLRIPVPFRLHFLHLHQARLNLFPFLYFLQLYFLLLLLFFQLLLFLHLLLHILKMLTMELFVLLVQFEHFTGELLVFLVGDRDGWLGQGGGLIVGAQLEVEIAELFGEFVLF